jgi:hypothetical protein
LPLDKKEGAAEDQCNAERKRNGKEARLAVQKPCRRGCSEWAGLPIFGLIAVVMM